MNIVSSLNENIMSLFREQRDHKLKSMTKMLVDSGKVVKRLLRNSGNIDAVICTKNFFETNQSLIEEANIGELCILEDNETKDIVGHRIHQGVMALADRPQDVKLDELGNKILILNGVNNAENVGAICRSALAFGVDSIVIDSNSCSPFVRRAIRVSMGSVFKMKFMHTDNLKDLLEDLYKDSYSIVSASNDEGAMKLKDVDFNKKTALVLGNEGDGVDEVIKNLSDYVVKIPINREVDSLNVAVASSILLYELGGL